VNGFALSCAVGCDMLPNHRPKSNRFT
jgi:hypothetical protein